MELCARTNMDIKAVSCVSTLKWWSPNKVLTGFIYFPLMLPGSLIYHSKHGSLISHKWNLVHSLYHSCNQIHSFPTTVTSVFCMIVMKGFLSSHKLLSSGNELSFVLDHKFIPELSFLLNFCFFFPFNCYICGW